jgi:hypothetical protein
MIKSMQHAQEVQARRAASGKLGYAHAVRRFANRTGIPTRAMSLNVNVKAKRS